MSKPTSEPSWIAAAWKYLGKREIPGPKHASFILRWLELLKSAVRDDETPWCASAIGGILEEVGIKSTRSLAARSYLTFGQALSKPVYGCIVVFWRGKPKGWQGHVAFVVGQDSKGNLLCLGGNQDDEFCIRAYSRDRVLAYRWPGSGVPPTGALPVSSSEEFSKSDA